ncbi:CBS domain-containing protein [Tropicimonas sediminicola]|uniref:CBS domain-containing protein n=1 Tax=Tropicimonas sediminicola TaxID=1031541 RepID=A0A239CNY9_9RHOB|nr:CBS domain-containing protein [Tropicimonas sediminicola]SNS21976.1 CBS domain-containing protein [Tropicimonas sediminicola]
MTTVGQILESKGRTVHQVGTDAMVLDALKLMAEANVGSVMVMDGETVAGIFTERQYARRVFLMGRAAPSTPVREVMEPDVIFVTPQDTVDECMALMSEKHIRHLPVMEGERLVGMVSIGDLMKTVIDEHKFHLDELVKYVSR